MFYKRAALNLVRQFSNTLFFQNVSHVKKKKIASCLLEVERLIQTISPDNSV